MGFRHVISYMRQYYSRSPYRTHRLQCSGFHTDVASAASSGGASERVTGPLRWASSHRLQLYKVHCGHLLVHLQFLLCPGGGGVLRSVCLSVCLCLCVSVREHNSGTAVQSLPIFAKFLCISPVAVAQSSSGGVAMRYVLPVLLMTSCLAVIYALCRISTPGRSLMSMNAV